MKQVRARTEDETRRANPPKGETEQEKESKGLRSGEGAGEKRNSSERELRKGKTKIRN